RQIFDPANSANLRIAAFQSLPRFRRFLVNDHDLDGATISEMAEPSCLQDNALTHFTKAGDDQPNHSWIFRTDPFPVERMVLEQETGAGVVDIEQIELEPIT